jgi:gamma-carbonic anhydrase
MDHYEIVVDDAGRVMLPAELLERLGWRPGAVLAVDVEAGGVRLSRHAPAPAGDASRAPAREGEPMATVREQARQLADAMRGLADTKEVRGILASLGLGSARAGASGSSGPTAARPPAAAPGSQLPAPGNETRSQPGSASGASRPFAGHAPSVPDSCYVDPTAVLIGQVALGEWCSVWPGTVLRGDTAPIQVGARTNIQDGAVLHCHPEHGTVTVGSGVTIGHGAVLHSCFVADHVLIGMRAVVLDGARIGEGAIVGAGAVVPPGMEVPPGELALGVPARVLRPVTPEEARSIHGHADGYVALQAQYRGVSPPETAPATRPPVYRCRRAASPIVVDGSLDETAWSRAIPTHLVLSGSGDPPRFSTEARLCWDERCLYVALSCKDTDIWGTFTQRDEPLYNEEVVELFLCPTGDLRHYFEFEVSPRNTLFDARVFNPEGDRRSMLVETEWDAPGIQTAVRVAGTLHDRTDVDLGWIAEIALPFVDLGLSGPPAAGDRWRFNLYRIERGEAEEYSAWSPTFKVPADFHVPDRFGILEFVED